MNLSVDLTNICRLCLCKTQICTSLLDNNGDEILYSLTSINIRDETNLPTGACIKCWLNIKLAYRIQQNVIDNTNKLIKIFKDRERQDEKGDIKTIDVFSESLSEFEPELVETTNIKKEIIVEDNNVEEGLNETVFFVGSYCSICNARICDNKMQCHIKKHFSQPQKCDECGIELENAETYQQHLINEHDFNTSNIFTCNTCPASFKYKCFYKMHIKKGHYSSLKRKAHPGKATVKIEKPQVGKPVDKNEKSKNHLRCLQCNKYCRSSNELLTHQKTHQRRRCPICNFAATSYNYNNHIKSHTDSQEICSICGKVFKNDASLRGHIYHRHSTRSYPCPHCDKTFTDNYHKIMHVRKEHTGERNYVCELCGKAFFTEYVRTRHHKIVHLKQRDYVCKYCNKGFSSRNALKTHERQHTNETPYKCDVCGEGFRQKISLRTHKKSKHMIEEELTETCTICGKKFASVAAIKSHMDKVH